MMNADNNELPSSLRRSSRRRNSNADHKSPMTVRSGRYFQQSTTPVNKKRYRKDPDETEDSSILPDDVNSTTTIFPTTSKRKKIIHTKKIFTKSIQRPTSEECEYAVSELGKLHPSVLEKTKQIRMKSSFDVVIKKEEEHVPNDSIADKVFSSSSCGYQPSILDGVISTMLSQNTTNANSIRAFQNLKKAYPDWNTVAELPDPTTLESYIRVAGLSKIRASNIWNICKTLMEERGEASFEYLRYGSDTAIQQELIRFKGLGKKTISCVLMFTLGRSTEFPVDTHVYRISKLHQWVPTHYKRDDAYEYLNSIVPNHLKMDLHCLLVQHGRECHRCAANNKPQFPPKDGSKLVCPLIQLKDIVMNTLERDMVKKEEEDKLVSIKTDTVTPETEKRKKSL